MNQIYKRKVRCLRSSSGVAPLFIKGHVYEVIKVVILGPKRYFRLRLENGATSNADANDFVDVGLESPRLQEAS